MKLAFAPHITEKTYKTIELSSSTGSTYTFKVNKDLDKGLIKKLIEREYKVSVEAVNIVNLPGKVRHFKGITGKTSTTKKALVRLKKGDTIAAFDIEDTKSGDKE